MAVDLIRHAKMDEQVAIQEAAAAGLRSLQYLVFQLSYQNSPSDCQEIADQTVAKFKKMISILNQTGHARFRRGPPETSSSAIAHESFNLPLQAPRPPAAATPASLNLDFAKSKAEILENSAVKLTDAFAISTAASSGNSSLISSLTGDCSVTNGKRSVSPIFTSGKPPLSSSHKKCSAQGGVHSVGDASVKHVLGVRCHCSKKRKSRTKRTVRVPAISSRNADIPSDEYSWRKYGQKPIKGSPYPRGYYRCSTVRGCPARKHVERALDDPTMLIVTYEGEHRHVPGSSIPPSDTAMIDQST